MAQHPVFVSYSRKEYFFTESLVLHLQRHHIDAWFDVQELEPGIGWKSDIQQGLNQCESLVLVASKAALASPYVKLEWQAALDAKKPVHMVFFEPVALPPELAAPTSIIDFTQDFERGISLLVKVLQERSSHCDPLPTAYRLPAVVEQLSHLLRRRVALWWALLAATLAIVAKSTVIILTTGFTADPNLSNFIYGLILVVSAIVLYVLWSNRRWLNCVPRLLKRDNIPVNLWFRASEFQTTAAFITIALTLPALAALQSLLALVMLVPAFLTLQMTLTRRAQNLESTRLFFHPDLLRWCHLGNEVPYDWRVLLSQALLPEAMVVEVLSKKVRRLASKGSGSTEVEVVTGVYVSVRDANPSRKTYRLYATPQVQEVEHYIKTILETNHFQEAQDEASPPDYHIVLVSPWTPIEATRALIQKYPDNTLPVLVATTDLHPLPDITHLQLIDFRQRYEPALASALQYLHTQAAQQRSVFSLSVLPVQLNRSFPLLELRSLQHAMLFMSSLCLFFGLIGLISLALPAVNSIFQPRPTIQEVLSALVYALTIGAAWWLRSSAYRTGRLTLVSPRHFRLVVVGMVLLMAGAFALGLQPQFAVNAGQVQGVIGDGLVWRGIGIVFLLLTSMVPIIHMQRAIRQGRIAPVWHDTLGVPPITSRFGTLQIRQFALITLMYCIAYSVFVLGANDAFRNITRDTGILYGFIWVVGIFALAGLGLLQRSMQPSVVKADVPFAFRDAPSLRYYLNERLRNRNQPPTKIETTS